jgi:hypothetical protein
MHEDALFQAVFGDEVRILQYLALVDQSDILAAPTTCFITRHNLFVKDSFFEFADGLPRFTFDGNFEDLGVV